MGTETATKVTLQDCINAYVAAKNTRETEELEKAETQRAAAEEDAREGCASVGIEPYDIQGSMTFFNFNGIRVTFLIKRWKHNRFGFYRILDDVCPQCGENFWTSEMQLDAYGVGWALSNPERNYHNCPNWMTPEKSPKPQTTAEKLLEALDAYIAETAGNHE